MRFACATRSLTALLLVLALVFALACGSTSSSSSAPPAPVGVGSGTAQTTAPAKHIRFATAKFLLHAGLAFGTFHRYLYKPLKAGALSHPLQHKLAVVKAAAAAVFIVHELRKASEDAQASALLRKLFSPLHALVGSLGGLASGLRGGRVDTAALGAANTQVEAIKQAASSAGVPVREAARAVP